MFQKKKKKKSLWNRPLIYRIPGPACQTCRNILHSKPFSLDVQRTGSSVTCTGAHKHCADSLLGTLLFLLPPPPPKILSDSSQMKAQCSSKCLQRKKYVIFPISLCAFIIILQQIGYISGMGPSSRSWTTSKFYFYA